MMVSGLYNTQPSNTLAKPQNSLLYEYTSSAHRALNKTLTCFVFILS